jgi:hypothetical protein
MRTPLFPGRPLPSVLLRFVGLALALGGCGGGLKYRIDDSAMDAIPAGERSGVFAAQNEMEIAKSESRTATSQLEALGHDDDIAKAERQQAGLEIEKANAEQEAAVQARDENRANAAEHLRTAADLGVKAADAKLAWLDQKEDWLKAVRAAADAHVAAAQAKVELEKARVAQQKGIKPDGEFSIGNYDGQYKDRKSDWEDAKKKSASAEKDSKEAEKKWQDLAGQISKMKT